ncbi:MAG: ABC transporter substrate-binding protein [Limnospira sp.]
MKGKKRRQIRVIWGTMILLLCLGLGGCVPGDPPPLQSLRVGINNWPGYTVALYGQEAGLFERRGITLDLVYFDHLQDAARAMMRGAVDATFVTLWDLMQVDPGNDSPALLMVTNLSWGSDGIVARPEIESVRDLAGRTVGANLGTINHLILLEALKLYDISPEVVQIENVLNETAAERLERDNLDGAVLWEPLLSETADRMGGNIIFTTRDVDSLVIDGLASRASFVARHERAFTQFILAWFDLMREVETRPERVFEGVARELGQTPEAFARDYGGLKKGDVALNRRMFSPGGRLGEATGEIVALLRKDPRHSRTIREDVKIETRPVMNAIEAWKP